MPVTARLSKAFYEKFGEDVVGQLEDWLNQVGAACRADARQFYAPGDAPRAAAMDEQIAELRREVSLATIQWRTDTESRLAALEARLAGRSR